MAESVAELRARLTVAELTEELVAAKGEGDVEVKREVAAALHAARAQFRTDFPPAAPAPGDAAATPAPITVGLTQKG